ncbi:MULTISPECIES: hypothetical protein [unclassified Luteococcus]|uniref:hypothetical protein n=1 Tax=unclassified Luteococcus TaxID=2639923 RepID=UPI00313D2CF9
MTPLALVAALVSLWLLAGMLWLADSPAPTQMADVILSATDDEVTAPLQIAC